MAKVQGLPVRGMVREVRVSAYVKPDGGPGLLWTADRSGGYHGVELYGIGPTGAVREFAFLSATDCRALASHLETEAKRLEEAEYAVKVWSIVPPA